MILTDTGPLVALLDRNDKYHLQAIHFVSSIQNQPFVTTWPCLTEAFYLVGSIGSYLGQQKLWSLHTTNRLQIHPLRSNEVKRMKILMHQYRDTPMDLADASLVATAESLNMKGIFTFDKHFYIYRLIDGNVLEVFP